MQWIAKPINPNAQLEKQVQLKQLIDSNTVVNIQFQSVVNKEGAEHMVGNVNATILAPHVSRSKIPP